MRKIIIKTMVVLLVMWGTPTFATSSNETSPTATNAVVNKAAILIERLEEIKEMDKSSLSQLEKKTLRHELHDIKKELKQQDRGVYISVGGVIIIILLLILLL